jgi:hypothetical protein
VCLQPYEFTAGEAVSGVAAKKISDSANGLFAGAGGPKPPPALALAVLGMRAGGKVQQPFHIRVACAQPTCVPMSSPSSWN